MMEYYPAIKRNEILIHATTWLKLKSIVLSEIETETNIVRFCLYEVSRLGKFIATESGLEVTREWLQSFRLE